jgi:hypothetical protein
VATPYAPSQLALANFDATQTATATWAFSSLDSTVTQASFRLQIYNNATGALVFDTGVVTSSLQQYNIPANTLVNRTQYKWRVQYTDSKGNVSPWSQFQVFTCSSVPSVAVTYPSPNQTISGNTLTVTCIYGQAQAVAQQSFRLILYASDQATIVGDTGTVYGATNQYTFTGLTSGTYYAQAIVTSADGLTATSGKVIFNLNYNAGAQSPNIALTPLPQQASIRIDWNNEQQLPGNYLGPGPTYKFGKWGQALQIAAYGEKVYWQFPAINGFTYTSWKIANLSSAQMKSNQVFADLRADSKNFIQVRYDPSDSSFIVEKMVNGVSMVAKSAKGITFSAGDQIFITIQQSSQIVAYIGVRGNFYPIVFNPYNPYVEDMLMGSGGMLSPSPAVPSTYGQAMYGPGVFASEDPGVVTGIQYAYMGCSPIDGNEANVLIDQTHLTINILSQADIQALYTNATYQSFTSQTVFLANFDGNISGGAGNGTPIASWNIYRTANGIRKKIGSIPYNQNLSTASFTDTTPLAGVEYQYDVVTVDPNGNEGTPQTIFGSVDFDGWWLTDLDTGTSFQLYVEVDDVPIKTNYKRASYETFGIYPITAYAPTRYRSGKLSGWIIGVNQPIPPYQQYQVLQSLIDMHKPLLLRGDEGWGMMVDCYEPTNTIPHRNHKQYNKVEFNWTEVASA